MITAMGTPACTFKQLWDNVAESPQEIAIDIPLRGWNHTTLLLALPAVEI